MKSFKKKLATVLLAGTMVVASLVPVSAATWKNTTFYAGQYEYMCETYCDDICGTAEIEGDVNAVYSIVQAGLTLYALNYADGSIDECGSSSEYAEDYVMAGVTIPEGYRMIYEVKYVSSAYIAAPNGGDEWGRTSLVVENK